MSTTSLNRSTKTTKIVYWIFTSIFVLLDGVIPALTFNSPMAIEGIRHLGYPDYFRIELSIGKIIGGLLLIIPGIPARLKEWAYVGFGISLISAMVSNWSVDGPGLNAFLPLIGFAILLTSYIAFHKLNAFYPR